MKTAIRFTASWCHPCQMYAPIWQKVTEGKPDFQFEVIDVDEQSDIASKYGVMSIPTTVILNEDGTVHKKQTGVMSEKKLEEFLIS